MEPADKLTQYEVIGIADNKSAFTTRMSPKLWSITEQADRAHINELNNF